MQIPERTRWIGDEDAIHLWWFVNGTLVNYASGYTFVAKLAKVSDLSTLIFTKTTGFTGAAGTGTEGDGTPNLTVSFATTGELNSVSDPGRYILEMKATKTSDSSETTMWMTLNMRARLG